MSNTISGRWFNQQGSEMELSVDADGKIRGQFRSGVGSPQHGEAFQLTGFVRDALVGFVVDFRPYDSITCWAGHVTDGGAGPAIHTLWNMTVGLPPGRQGALWQGVWSGADTFQRAPNATTARGGARPSHPTAA